MRNENERLVDLRKVKHKVFAYITYQHQLLVFHHPFAPEAGIQVPAGTVEEQERAEDAVLREAFIVPRMAPSHVELLPG
ncbi:MAG TPA: NUDIX domain-containing protein [Ktedonobacteraceae bacterium]|nr:NUDIX domain-containing protein [Ktedonobacteraceae bacterium]